DKRGWSAGGQATIASEPGVLIVNSIGEDPSIATVIDNVEGPVVLQLRARSATAGSGEIFWSTKENPGFSPDRVQRFALRHDGQWHQYTVLIDTTQTLDRLRIDPGSAPGRIEIDWIRLR